MSDKEAFVSFLEDWNHLRLSDDLKEWPWWHRCPQYCSCSRWWDVLTYDTSTLEVNGNVYYAIRCIGWGCIECRLAYMIQCRWVDVDDMFICGRIAQSVERSANNAVVLGSSPSMTISFNPISTTCSFCSLLLSMPYNLHIATLPLCWPPPVFSHSSSIYEGLNVNILWVTTQNRNTTVCIQCAVPKGCSATSFNLHIYPLRFACIRVPRSIPLAHCTGASLKCRLTPPVYMYLYAAAGAGA